MTTAESQTGYLEIQALVPEAELLEYANELKSMTKGTGFFNLEFDSYKQVPEALQRQKIEPNKEKNKAAAIKDCGFIFLICFLNI